MLAGPLPPPLKIPEVSRFINRANQLRTIKPAIAYWCEYHAVNQIVTKSLHTSDDDCFAFTKSLIERLEATKAERADDDAVVDNMAGQAYVEQFAQETFSRAERAMRANKVTRQTADTFDAAATFFDVTHEWGTPDPEVLKKIRFAKWNAARILKAIREGRDPNESNPSMEAQQQQQQQLEGGEELLLSPGDAAAQHAFTTQSGPPRPSVEDVQDTGEQPGVDVDAQGAYFPPNSEPSVPSLLSQSPGPVPSAPSPEVLHIPAEVPSPSPPPSAPSLPPPGSSIPHSSGEPPQPWTSMADPPSIARRSAPNTSSFPAPPATAAPLVPVPVPSAPAVPAPTPKSIEQAQKHAKWAISALNFEDIPTAVQELRNALAVLGCR
ncbi:hypothetical protein E4U41_005940 [Claviceps citrina]|nr:hypothetical protein E4U41_005940 [Claviceps citrina]